MQIKKLDIPFWGRCAIVTNRQNPLIWFWHGVNCGRSNLLEEGLSSLKRSILIDPEHGNSYQAISVMFQRCGALEKAYFFAKVTKRLSLILAAARIFSGRRVLLSDRKKRVGNTGLVVSIMMVRWKDAGCQERDGGRSKNLMENYSSVLSKGSVMKFYILAVYRIF